MEPEKQHITIKDISPEVLSEIFIYCLPKEVPPVPSIKDAPLCLGRVCSSWRIVANSTPQLWSEIGFEIVEDMKFTAAALDFWIKKSGNLPLSISVLDLRNVDTEISGKMDESVLAFANSICAYSQRWMSLKLKGGVGRFPGLHKIFQVFRDSAGLPLLEELKIKFSYLKIEFTENISLDFTSCPTNSLTKFKFNINSPNQFSGNWFFSGLRHLEIPSKLTPNRILEYLRRTPSVETVQLTIKHWSSDVDDRGELVSLLNLSNITIALRDGYNGWESHYMPFFSKLNTPALETVKIKLWNCNDNLPSWEIPEVFMQLLIRSRPPLTSLEIWAEPTHVVVWNNWIRCLSHTPLLRRLTFGENENEITEIFRALCLRSNFIESFRLCPYLEELYIECCIKSPAEFKKYFKEMLRTRFGGNDSRCVKLHDVHIIVHDGSDPFRFDERDEIEFQAYRRNGLNLTITFDSPTT